jgi:hypothetical protein
MRRTNEDSVRDIGQHKVVAVAALPGQQPFIFLPPNRLPDAMSRGDCVVH